MLALITFRAGGDLTDKSHSVIALRDPRTLNRKATDPILVPLKW